MSSFQQMFAFRGAGDDEAPDEFPEPPVWGGPPESELGECVPLSVVVGRSEKAVVALRHASVYSTGTILDVVAVARGLRERDAQRFFHDQRLLHPDEDLPESLLRIGVESADGARISNLGNPQHGLWQPGTEPEGPVFSELGGSSGSGAAGGFTLQRRFWLWPLPPPGTLRVFVEWPALDVALSSADIDAGLILDAAARSQPLWPS